MDRARVEHSDSDWFFDQSADLLCVLDFEGNVVSVNDAWRATLGWIPTELKGESLVEWIHPEDRGHAEEQLKMLAQGSAHQTGVYRVRGKDDDFKHLNWRCTSDQGLRRIYAIARDITAKPRSPEDSPAFSTSLESLRRLSTDEALRRANQTLSQIIAACPHAIVAVDRDRNVRIWNPAAERIFGWSSKEVLGGRVPFVSESQRKHSDLFNQRALGGEVIQNLELQRTRRDGKRLDLLVSAAPTYDDLGAVDGFLTVATDVTQNKQLEQQLLRGQRLESLGSMASGIAHDLNNVLSPIRTALQLFRVNSADPMMQHTVDTLESCVKRGADLIRQVLTFARGVQGERILLETRQAVQETERVVLQTLPKTITVMTDVQEDLWCVLADLTQFHQVLMNLCINARDAMPNGGKLTVIARNVVLDHARQLVSIEVRDTGCGIAAETRDKIFEPFFTTKAPGQGTGLGLSTVAAIVRNHGGFVEVESRVGEGTSFKVYFPAIPGKEARRTLKSRNVMPVGNGELVLLVDDEAAVRDIARLTLEMHGYRVLEARDGAEGVALYAQHRNEVSVVISDMDMPVMTGSSMIQSLEWINPQVRIISASGLVGESQANDHNASSPVRVILPKPYTAEELLRTVHDVIRVA